MDLLMPEKITYGLDIQGLPDGTELTSLSALMGSRGMSSYEIVGIIDKIKNKNFV